MFWLILGIIYRNFEFLIFNFEWMKLFSGKKILILGLLLLSLYSIKVSAADNNPGFFPLPNASQFGDLPDAVGTSGTLGAENLVDKISKNAKYIIGVIAIALIVYSGFKLVALGLGGDQLDETKKGLLYMVLGLALLGLAMPISEIVNFKNGGPFSSSYEISQRVTLFKNTTNIVITFIKYILGSIATLFTAIAGGQLVTALKNDSALDEAKKKLYASILGLLTVLFSGTFIDKIIYKVDINQIAKTSGLNPTIDANAALSEIIGATNFVVSFIGPLLILVFIAAGIYYVISFQDESRSETAKKWMTNAFIGLVVVYGAFAIVGTFVSGKVGG